MDFHDPMQAWMFDVLVNHHEQALSRVDGLLSKASIEPGSGCLVSHTETPQKLRFLARQMDAYRFIWCVTREVALPYRRVLRHTCANRRCINPDHLETGDRRDNKHDEWAHAAYGSNITLEPRE